MRPFSRVRLDLRLSTGVVWDHGTRILGMTIKGTRHSDTTHKNIAEKVVELGKPSALNASSKCIGRAEEDGP